MADLAGWRSVYLLSAGLTLLMARVTEERTREAGQFLGSIGSTAIYAWSGWIGVCLLGAGINTVALGYWWWTCSPNLCGEGACSRWVAQRP